MQIILKTFIVLMLSFVSFTVQAKTIEVKSESFVMIGDISERNGKALLLELEQYRQAILQVMGVTDIRPEIIPVRIYTAKNPKQLKLLTGRTDIGGIYTTTLEGPIFILSSKKGFSRGNHARHIALHEYTHHLLAAYAKDVYPLWYNEGLANYFSTFVVNKKGHLIIGRPYQEYAYALSQKVWMPTNVVSNSIVYYPYKSTGKKSKGLSPASYFYAQTWLMVHYLQSVKGEPEKLGKYVDLLNSQRDKSYMFKEAFGRTPEEFHKILKAYHKQNKYRVMTIIPKIEIREHDFSVTVLDEGMAAFHRAEAMRIFQSPRIEISTIKQEYEKAAKTLGETAPILIGLANLAGQEKKYTLALEYVEKALLLEPDNANAQRTLGIMLVSKNDQGNGVNSKEIKRARAFLMKAMIQNPDDIIAHYYYAMTYDISRVTPSAQAIASAQTALDYYKSDNFVDSNLGLAAVLMNGKKYQEAMPVLDKALIWSHNSGARINAQSMKRYIERVQ